jgi:hypothetical protein
MEVSRGVTFKVKIRVTVSSRISFQLVREKTKALENRLIDAQNQLSNTLQEIMQR